MVKQCRKNGHPYFNEDGTLNTDNVWINPGTGTPVCKACRRSGGTPGRPRRTTAHELVQREAAHLAPQQAVAWFIARCSESYEAFETVRALHDDYAKWCRARGERPRLSRMSSAWHRELVALGLEPGRTATARGFYGAKLLQ